MQAQARELISTIRAEIDQAADVILIASERGLHEIAAARGGEAEALESLHGIFCAMLEACAFQDLIGQRLSRLEGMLSATPLRAATDDPLLNGPAAPGKGLDQTAADALMGGAGP